MPSCDPSCGSSWIFQLNSTNQDLSGDRGGNLSNVHAHYEHRGQSSRLHWDTPSFSSKCAISCCRGGFVSQLPCVSRFKFPPVIDIFCVQSCSNCIWKFSEHSICNIFVYCSFAMRVCVSCCETCSQLQKNEILCCAPRLHES